MGLSKYHVVIISFYAILVPVLVFLFPNVIRYHIEFERLGISAIVCGLLLWILFIFYSHKRDKKIQIHTIFDNFFKKTRHALLFAVPEEILFRGIIQTELIVYVGGTMSVLFGAVIFGVAHALNGAKGYMPYQWNWRLVWGASFVGIPLGVLFAISESLFFPTLLHIVILILLQTYESNQGISNLNNQNQK